MLPYLVTVHSPKAAAVTTTGSATNHTLDAFAVGALTASLPPRPNSRPGKGRHGTPNIERRGDLGGFGLAVPVGAAGAARTL